MYDSFNILKAEGKQLDDLAALQGLSRIAGSATSGLLQVTGNDGVTVVQGSLFENPITQDQFASTADLTLTTLNCESAIYSVKTLLASETYTVSVNSVVYSYVSSVTPSETEILNGLKTQIDADSTKTWESEVDGTAETLRIYTTDSD